MDGASANYVRIREVETSLLVVSNYKLRMYVSVFRTYDRANHGEVLTCLASIRLSAVVITKTVSANGVVGPKTA